MDISKPRSGWIAAQEYDMATQSVDPWVDEDFPNVDFSKHAEDAQLADDLVHHDQLNPEVVDNRNAPEPEPEPAPVVVAEEPEPEEPETIDLGNGGTATIDKTKKGWRASLDVGVGGVQNFYGKTKGELLGNLLKAQANATTKIRDLNRQVKLGAPVESTAPAPSIPTTVAGRKLTDDEIFDFKTKLQTNPDLAIEEWFTKRYGVSPDQLVKGYKEGTEASRQLQLEAIHKEFLVRCPEYYPDEKYENYLALVGYLAKHKLGRALTKNNSNAIVAELMSRGQYTVDNLEEAYTDLNDSGLLLQVPRPKDTATPVAPQAQPAGRIVRTETRPRAGLGIRPSEVSNTPAPPAKKPLSAEDYENLPDDVIDKLISQESRRIRAGRR